MANKIITELSAFQKFKESFDFKEKPITNIDGIPYCEGLPILDDQKKFIAENEKWINIGYHIKGSLSKILSNLFPYDFTFRGFELKSIESFFQGIKFTDPDIQKLVFNYSGVHAYHLKGASDYQWQKTGYLYFQGEPINRYEKEYQNIVDELYISAAQNPLYRQALKNVDRPLIHSIGETNPDETVLTKYEYEKQINALAAFFKTTD